MAIRKLRVMVINDNHPKIFPGAATIAERMARDLSGIFEVTFCWPHQDSSNVYIESMQFSGEEEVEFCRSKGGKRAPRISLFRKFLFLILLRSRVNRDRPDVIWFHNVGVHFPRIAIVMIKSLGFPVMITLHDYTWLTWRNSKLYPEQLVNGKQIDDSGIIPLDSAKLRGLKYISLKSLILEFSLKYHRAIFKFIDEVICISKQQQSIYSANGFRVDSIVANYVPICNCTIETKDSVEQINILFAGRPIGKGLDLVLDLVSHNANHYLHLAGREELEVLACKVIDTDRFSYHGQLNEQEMVKLLHEVDIVLCLSQCFDVYPTVVLESLAHGVAMLLSNTCGNFPLLNQVCPESIVWHGEKINELAIISVIETFKHSQRVIRELVPHKNLIIGQLSEIIEDVSSCG